MFLVGKLNQILKFKYIRSLRVCSFCSANLGHVNSFFSKRDGGEGVHFTCIDNLGHN